MSRTDFEAAYIERYGHRPRGWSDDFQVYQDAHANGAWFGWQAGAAGIEAKAAPVGEREAFEAWAESVGYHTERDMFQPDKYQSTLTFELWRVWQAAAATPAPVQAEPASLCDARVMDVLLMWNRRHEEPPIKVGYEYGVAQTVMQIMRGQPLPPAPEVV